MNGKKILVVEDDAVSRFVISEMLDEMGHDVLLAEDGIQGLQMAHEHADQIGMILMDVHMPLKSGADATAEIRRAVTDPPRDLPVVAMSADQDWIDTEQARAVGFSSGLSKPVRMDVLARMIEMISGVASFSRN